MSDTAHGRPKQFTFGPSALVTPANAVTVARLLAAPVYVLMLIAWGASWVNVVVGFVLAASAVGVVREDRGSGKGLVQHG